MRTCFLLLVVICLLIPSPIYAWQPTKPVTVIVAFKAGSGTDSNARLLARFAQKYIGQPLIIKNLPGGDGQIGWTKFSRSRPDGYTLGFLSLPSFTTLSASPNATYSVNDIVPIANHVTETGVIVVDAKSRWRDIHELIKDIRAAPGVYRCSTNGYRASNHIAALLFAKSAKLQFKTISFGGTADQLAALRSGEVHFTCAKVADVAPLARPDKEQRYRILAVFSARRLPFVPDAPTLAELGFYDQWYGSARCIAAPAGTPRDIIAFYEEAFKNTMEDPECIEAHVNANMTLDYQNSKELADRIASQLKFSREAKNLFK